jgi:hypothetical protein
VIKKEAEKVLKHKDRVEIQRMWNVKTKVIPVIKGAIFLIRSISVVRIEYNKLATIYVPFNTTCFHQIILTLHVSVFRPSSGVLHLSMVIHLMMVELPKHVV